MINYFNNNNNLTFTTHVYMHIDENGNVEIKQSRYYKRVVKRIYTEFNNVKTEQLREVFKYLFTLNILLKRI